MFEWFKRENSFRPLKEIPEGHKIYRVHQLSRATLGAGDLRKAVKLPPNENENDWLANGVVDFYCTLNSLFSLICEKCSEERCPEMKAGAGFQYFWQDKQLKKVLSLPAKQYI